MGKLKNKKSLIIIIASFVIILVISILSFFSWYKNSLKPVSPNEKDSSVRIVIPEKTGTVGIAEILHNKGLIKNELSMKIYAKMNKINNLKAGKYDLNRSDDLPTILSHIQNGDIANDEVKITFIEGKNIRWFAKKIADKTNNTEDDVYNLLKDEEYMIITLDDVLNAGYYVADNDNGKVIDPRNTKATLNGIKIKLTYNNGDIKAAVIE